MAQEGQQEGQQGLGRALVVPAHAPDHVAPSHAALAAKIETEQKMVTEPLADGTQALSCFGWGTGQKGPRFGAGLGGDVQLSQGR